jgi:hypothetical protein
LIQHLLGVEVIEMTITIGKVASLAIAAVYVVAMFLGGGSESSTIIEGCIALLLPLALIWFPEELGSMTGYVGRGGNIDTETPPFMVSFAGWFFLVGLPLIFYLFG